MNTIICCFPNLSFSSLGDAHLDFIMCQLINSHCSLFPFPSQKVTEAEQPTTAWQVPWESPPEDTTPPAILCHSFFQERRWDSSEKLLWVFHRARISAQEFHERGIGWG